MATSSTPTESRHAIGEALSSHGTGQACDIRRLFAAVGFGVLRAWLVACGLVTLLHAAAIGQGWIDASTMRPGLVIAMASGLISLAALAPGFSLATPVGSSHSKRAVALTGTFLVGCVAAMAIRFVGTVALLLACRYQFGLRPENLALLVCGWYVLMTTCEIVWLVRGARSLNPTSPVGSPSASPQATRINPSTGSKLG